MAIEIVSGDSGDKLEVTTGGAAKTTLYDGSGAIMVVANGTDAPTIGCLAVGGQDGNVFRTFDVDKSGRMETPSRRLVLWEQCEGATLNGQRWLTTATTMTATQTAAGIVLNGSAIVTTTTGVLLTSRWQTPRYVLGGLGIRIRARSTLVANQAGELGFGFSGTLSGVTAQVENGAMWRINTDGTVVPVLIYNSTEITGTDVSGSLVNTDYYDYYVTIGASIVEYFIIDSVTGNTVAQQFLRLSDTGPKLFNVTHLYVWLRARNNTVPVSAGQLIIPEVECYQFDQLHFEDWKSQLAGNSQGANLLPTTFAQSQTFANSAFPTAATLSNTAASYTTLGGLYQYAATATVGTDWSLFSFVVPAPYRLKVYSVTISMINTGAANAATPATTLFWGIGTNGASANLSTGAHIRTALGTTSIPISSAIGATSPDLRITFETPIICNPGLTFSVIAKQISGAATASQVIQGHVTINGVFE